MSFLAGVLEEFRRRGEIKVEDSRRAAEHFIGMLRDDLHLRVVLGLRPPPDVAEVDLSVRQAVQIFLDGCRTTAAGKTRIATAAQLRTNLGQSLSTVTRSRK
jgi:hypothetical protein